MSPGGVLVTVIGLGGDVWALREPPRSNRPTVTIVFAHRAVHKTSRNPIAAFMPFQLLVQDRFLSRRIITALPMRFLAMWDQIRGDRDRKSTRLNSSHIPLSR